MLDTLMIQGGYRIDYFNRQVWNRPEAIGLYLRAEIRPGEIYSFDAKQRFFAGMMLLEAYLGREFLAAVYLDVDQVSNLARPAYQRLKKDIRAGGIARVLVTCPADLLGEGRADDDVKDLVEETNVSIWCFDPDEDRVISLAAAQQDSLCRMPVGQFA